MADTVIHPSTELTDNNRIIKISLEAPAKPNNTVTPAKAGVQRTSDALDSCFRRNDAESFLQEAPLKVFSRRCLPQARRQKGRGRMQIDEDHSSFIMSVVDIRSSGFKSTVG
jgi:hypothetical protein